MTRSADRPRARPVELIRAGWGLTLLLAPAHVLGQIHHADIDPRALLVTRILGARHLLQAGLSGLRPTRRSLTIGAGVDAIHAVTALSLAAVDPDRSRLALADAGIAAIWAALGAHDRSHSSRLSTG